MRWSVVSTSSRLQKACTALATTAHVRGKEAASEPFAPRMHAPMRSLASMHTTCCTSNHSHHFPRPGVAPTLQRHLRSCVAAEHWKLGNAAHEGRKQQARNALPQLLNSGGHAGVLAPGG